MSDFETADSPAISIDFHTRRCIHARHCVLSRPDVFVPNVVGPWIHPEAATAEKVAALAHACPSGAIRYRRHDGVADEAPPKVNLVRVRENGPLAIHAEVTVMHANGRQGNGLRMTLCRCGAAWRSFAAHARTHSPNAGRTMVAMHKVGPRRLLLLALTLLAGCSDNQDPLAAPLGRLHLLDAEAVVDFASARVAPYRPPGSQPLRQRLLDISQDEAWFLARDVLGDRTTAVYYFVTRASLAAGMVPAAPPPSALTSRVGAFPADPVFSGQAVRGAASAWAAPPLGLRFTPDGGGMEGTILLGACEAACRVIHANACNNLCESELIVARRLPSEGDAGVAGAEVVRRFAGEMVAVAPWRGGTRDVYTFSGGRLLKWDLRTRAHVDVPPPEGAGGWGPGLAHSPGIVSADGAVLVFHAPQGFVVLRTDSGASAVADPSKDLEGLISVDANGAIVTEPTKYESGVRTDDGNYLADNYAFRLNLDGSLVPLFRYGCGAFLPSLNHGDFGRVGSVLEGRINRCVCNGGCFGECACGWPVTTIDPGTGVVHAQGIDPAMDSKRPVDDWPIANEDGSVRLVGSMHQRARDQMLVFERTASGETVARARYVPAELTRAPDGVGQSGGSTFRWFSPGEPAAETVDWDAMRPDPRLALPCGHRASPLAFADEASMYVDAERFVVSGCGEGDERGRQLVWGRLGADGQPAPTSDCVRDAAGACALVSPRHDAAFVRVGDWLFVGGGPFYGGGARFDGPVLERMAYREDGFGPPEAIGPRLDYDLARTVALEVVGDALYLEGVPYVAGVNTDFVGRWRTRIGATGEVLEPFTALLDPGAAGGSALHALRGEIRSRDLAVSFFRGEGGQERAWSWWRRDAEGLPIGEAREGPGRPVAGPLVFDGEVLLLLGEDGHVWTCRFGPEGPEGWVGTRTRLAPHAAGRGPVTITGTRAEKGLTIRAVANGRAYFAGGFDDPFELGSEPLDLRPAE